MELTPMPAGTLALQDLERSAADAAQLLKLLANEHRLLILCRLAAERELAVGELMKSVKLGQSALSQHLARMREEGLLATRRDAQTIYYRIANRDVARILSVLRNIYCP
jgi:DNA-binding transcriptional ArsR family regulator